MFVHLGGDTVIRSKDVIAILDRQIKDTSSITNEFLQFYKGENIVVEITEDVTKSIVITAEKIYFSPISSATLKRRALYISDIDDI